MEQNEAYGGSVRIQDQFPYRISEVWHVYLMHQNYIKKIYSKQNCFAAADSLSFNVLGLPAVTRFV